MKKNSAGYFLALGLAALASPALATHPNEHCRVTVDLSAVTKAIGSDAAKVRVRFIYHTNMTDMNPVKPEMVSRPADGKWIYQKDLYASLYERSLAAVRIESELYKPEDGTPVWSVRIDRPAPDAQTDASPIKCEVYAD